MGSSRPRDRTRNLNNNKFPGEVLWLENGDPDFICMLSVVLKVLFKLFTKSRLQGFCSSRYYRVVMSRKGRPHSSGWTPLFLWEQQMWAYALFSPGRSVISRRGMSQDHLCALVQVFSWFPWLHKHSLCHSDVPWESNKKMWIVFWAPV